MAGPAGTTRQANAPLVADHDARSGDRGPQRRDVIRVAGDYHGGIGARADGNDMGVVEPLTSRVRLVQNCADKLARRSSVGMTRMRWPPRFRISAASTRGPITYD
jgi:hypothetical protein